ncbi:DUF3822 family protein [Flexithrix dorotheae]|uniref:DUF3822 family protein n=1 Tax=Flexithrix dorotheae TaxID=70993 RepID=UPI000367E99A|nr:DUF3822 family protein [Flexithrix dorotheae]
MEDIIHNSTKYNLVDQNFDINLLSQYKLFIKLHKTGVTVFVVDSSNSRCLALEKYQYELALTDNALIVSLQNVWSNHNFLNAGFWKEVVVIPSDLKFAFVPSELLSTEIKAVDYLRLNAPVNLANTLVKQADSPDYKTTCCFSIGKSLYEWVNSYYPTISTKVIHNNTCFLWGLYKLNQGKQKKLFVNVEGDIVTIVSIDGKNLKYINSFEFHSESDFVYYIMLVVQELNIPAKEVELKIWGSFDEESDYIPELKKYIKHVQLGKRPTGLKFNYQFDEISEFHNFDVLSAYDINI